MTATRKVLEAAEAICGALHKTDFLWLGDSQDGASSWFTRGTKPQIVRIEVVRSELAPMVLVNIEWPNFNDPHNFKRGRQTCQVDVRGSANEVFLVCERAVTRCLEVYRDVISGEGVAGPAAVAPKVTPDVDPDAEV